MRANAVHWRVFVTQKWANLAQNPTAHDTASLSLAPHGYLRNLNAFHTTNSELKLMPKAAIQGVT